MVDAGLTEIPIQRYAANIDNAPILLWLPASRGTSPMQGITASALGAKNIETWVVDLHLAYFLDEGRGSTEQFKPADIAELISIASQRTDKKVYLMSTDTGAVPLLEGIALAQRKAAQVGSKAKIGGALLFHPALAYPVSNPGTKATFRPIAKNSTIPIYYFQPSISTKQWHSQEIIEVLESGGSPVFFHPLPGVVAGFHLRPEDHLSEIDIAQRAELPEMIRRAVSILSMQKTPTAPKALATVQKSAANKQRFGLKQLNDIKAKPLALIDMQSTPIVIDYSQYALSLVSFWAGWCEPCIKELPAIDRLHRDYDSKGLQIITINVGESVQEIEKVMQEFDMSAYINLRDPEGKTMKVWNVYGFPTNFLVDQNGTLSYGSFGAVEWDEQQNRQFIDALLTH